MKYLLSTLALVLLFCSCKENAEVGEYDNWKERNQHYVDSIATLATMGTDGWEKICAYYFNDTIEALSPNNSHYVYVKKMEAGKGTYRPQYNDSIRVHYLGRLIPSDAYPQGYVFDRSYAGYELNEATDVPTLFAVNSLVTGFTTATMHMVEGDRWKVVIPQELGYGVEASGKIQGYSALLFDIKMSRIYRYKEDTNTDWH